jgi:glycosyltransferase involved in cell wall biosynthesis
MTADITVVIPTIAPRAVMLGRALESALGQVCGPGLDRLEVTVVPVHDTHHHGAATTRNAGLLQVTTEWVAFLDDDDTMEPGHLSALFECAQETGADLVYPWFHLPNGADPFPDRFGVPFDAAELTRRNFIPVTVLARTELIKAVGGFQPLNTSTESGASPCEDWGCWQAMLAAGARFVHLPERTWTWNWWSGNTSGRGDRW